MFIYFIVIANIYFFKSIAWNLLSWILFPFPWFRHFVAVSGFQILVLQCENRAMWPYDWKILKKNCVTSDHHQIWPTGSRRHKPITGLVSLPNRWYASRNDVLKTHKNGGGRGKEFVASLAIKKYLWRRISTKYVLHNEFKSFLDHKLVNKCKSRGKKRFITIACSSPWDHWGSFCYTC